ncbi:hypothetical protein Salmi_Mp050 (mitochondrion) [Salvia miltiorrhiza]|uniref:Uncharacterized protein n=1 Tax=Salvia miltiorrhiza TaxID=226208 RepID=V9P4R7_SALMI|nr:hypothetical protein Salmi_Mp050 [Salvia miltiorrhiza]AGU16580.1 hypothetical protein Salmi_Mp050 [Salvia miltiorrhiza]
MALERNRVATPFGITASLRKMWFVQRRIQVNQNAFAIPIKYSILWIVLPRNKKTDRLEYPKQSRHPRIRESAQYSLFYDGKIPIVRIQWQLHRFNEQPGGPLPRVGSIQVTKSPKRRRMESIDRPLRNQTPHSKGED